MTDPNPPETLEGALRALVEEWRRPRYGQSNYYVGLEAGYQSAAEDLEEVIEKCRGCNGFDGDRKL